MFALMISLCLSTGSAAGVANLQTGDGVSLKASTASATNAKQGVVLLHMDGRSRLDWDFFADRLGKNGVAAVAPDLRGHGNSQGTKDYPRMVEDVRASIDHLIGQGVEQITCVGAELGANLCVVAAATDARISAVGLLSPRLNLQGLNAPKAMQAYGKERPVLIVASAEDPHATRAADILLRLATDDARYEVLDEAGIGTRMLNRDPSLEGSLLDWISGTSALGGLPVATPRPDTVDDTTVETQGETLRAHQQ
ncbi:MAG: alpha/beta fold hydrolase [Myxococcota bacterium]